MESPLIFGNTGYDYTPLSHSGSPIMREFPIHTPNCDAFHSLINRRFPRHPKVIPVRSELSSHAALKIQKAFRGHLVRKSVNKITGIKRAVDEISKQVTKKETAELVRTDAKERLKVVETLMNFLLKLDSVKCVDSGVRELRKAVVKKAIALQERVEATAANHQRGETGVNNQKDSFGNSSESRKKDELLEKMMKEHEWLLCLVTELVHQDEKKKRLLGSLSQRVEQLERALINERLIRRKSRHYSSVDCRDGYF